MSPAKKKLSTWEKAKKSKQETMYKQLLKWLFVFVVAIIVFSQLPSLIKFIRNPFPTLQSQRGKEIDLGFRTNFVLLSFEEGKIVDLAAISLEPQDKALSAVKFDLKENTPLKVKVGEIFESRGVDGLEVYVGNSLGIPIDGYLAFDRELYFENKEIVKIREEVSSVFLLVKLFLKKQDMERIPHTNLSLRQFWFFSWALGDSTFDQKDIVKFQPELEDQEGSFIDRKILEEGGSVVIRNSSGHEGLATLMKRYVENLGANVVSTETGEEVIPKTILYHKNDRDFLEQRLRNMLPTEKKQSKELSTDLLLDIGRDAIDWLTWD